MTVSSFRIFFIQLMASLIGDALPKMATGCLEAGRSETIFKAEGATCSAPDLIANISANRGTADRAYTIAIGQY